MTQHDDASNPSNQGASDSKRGIEVELLVRELELSIRFARVVLGAEVVSSANGVAVLRAGGSRWTMRSDAEGGELREIAALVVRRGAGVALHVEVADVDAAAAKAREEGGHVLFAARDTGRGTRAAHVVDRDGYVWVVEARAR
jgi:predicted enzyme related to lactoylglutathione lyase